MTPSSSFSSDTPRVSGTCVTTKASASTPIPAKTKNTPVMPIAATIEGNRRASTPLTAHPKNTDTPMPRPRTRSGKISASHTQTATLRNDCIEKTKAMTSSSSTQGRHALPVGSRIEATAMRRWQAVVRRDRG